MAVKTRLEFCALNDHRCMAHYSCALCEDLWEAATEAAKEKVTSTGNDYAKCADDILALDCVDAVINKRGVLVAILKRHFA